MAAASTSRSPPMSTSPFPPPPSAATGAARSPTVSASTASFLRDIADATEQRFGTPNALPGPPPSHFFPSVPRAQREKARQARLASASPPPPPPHPKDYPPTGLAALAAVAGAGAGAGGAAVGEKSSSPDLDEQDQEVLLERQRQAKVALAASGPFDNRRPSAVSIASTGSGGPFSTAVKSVGTGGSGGTKRRHRDEDRTSWDAASELVRLEREKEKAVFGGKSKGKGKEVVRMDEDQEKTPTPSVAASFSGPRPVSLVNGAAAQNGNSAMAVDEGEAEDRPPPVPSKSLSPEVDDGRAPSFVSADTAGEEDDELAEGDDAMTMDDVSIRSGVSGMSKATGAEEGGNEPAKKRSRTLTTPAQTAVLNALLAKTRFPSTETREEVGKQIGMSARRVQIWFQNRRQSQKRQRDREAQEAQAAAAAGHALSQHHLLQQQHFQQQHAHLPQPAYQHAYAQHAHIDPYSAQAQAAHLYAPVQLKPHDPYSALPHPHQHPHLQASSRPDLHHRISADSIASRASLAQSQHSGMSSMHALSTHGSERDGLGPLPSETRMAHPAAYASSPYGRQFAVPPHPSDAAHPQYPHHLQQQPRPSLSIPSKLYFPHVPRPHPHGPPGRLRVDSYAPSPPSPISQQPTQNAHGEQVKLPSLSAILSPPASAAPSAAAPVAPAHAPPPPQQPPFSRPQIHAPLPVPVSHEAMFSHSPFSPPPTHATIPSPASSAAPSTVPPFAPSFPTGGAGRALFSPEPSASSFERLRISGGPLSPPPPPSSTTTPSPFSPLSPSTVATTPSVDGHRDSVDILDVAVETMAYRASGRHLPARQVLPPLRSVLGDTAMNAKRPNKGGHSEADKALLAPILPSAVGPSSSDSAAGPPRLAPISTFAPLTAPSPPTAHSTLASPASSASTAYPPPPPPPVGSTPPQPSNLRASTWSANSHATTATRSTADFDFAHPPSGSYRAAERAANGSGWAGHLLNGGGGGGGGGAGAGVGAGPMRERNGSTATSARTSVSSEAGK